MSLTDRRPVRRSSRSVPAAAPPLPLVVAGALAGAMAAVVSYAVLAVIALLAWMADPSAAWDWAQLLEVAAGAWLSGQGVALQVLGVPLSLAPLGFSLLSLLAVVVAMRWAVSASAVARAGEAVLVAVAASVVYGGFAALLAILGRHLGVSPMRAFVTVAVVILVVCLVSLAVQVPPVDWSALPAAVRDAAAAAVASVALLVVAAALLLATSLVVHFADIGRLLGALDLGLAGAILLAALSLAYVPTAIVWSACYLLGPGVALTPALSVSPFESAGTATLPGLPIFAALPAQSPSWAAALPLTIVVIGAVTGWLLRRRGWAGLIGVAVGLGAAAASASLVALGAWLATGALGAGSLAAMGPSPLVVAGAAFGGLALGSAVVVVWPRRVDEEVHHG